jgi:hypothetical protein
MRLDDLAIQYGTDKSSSYHGYASQYEFLLTPLREAGAASVLEIGVCRKWDGNRHICPSLAMWAEWFGGDVHVVGADKCDFGICGERISTVLCDQGNPFELSGLSGSLSRRFGLLDLVVDDGSHVALHQQITLATLWGNLRPGGAYVIEDLNYNPEKLRVGSRMRTRQVVEDWVGAASPCWQVDLGFVFAGVSRVEWASSSVAGPRSAVVLWKEG